MPLEDVDDLQQAGVLTGGGDRVEGIAGPGLQPPPLAGEDQRPDGREAAPGETPGWPRPAGGQGK
jgi:hypothetical protein